MITFSTMAGALGAIWWVHPAGAYVIRPLSRIGLDHDIAQVYVHIRLHATVVIQGRLFR
jgi:hypothetical protein